MNYPLQAAGYLNIYYDTHITEKFIAEFMVIINYIF